MPKIMWIVFAVMLASALSFADVGPSPSAPTVVVHMVSGGSPDASVDEITYHCMGDPTDDTGAVTQRAMAISCSEGNCTNEGGDWFYKFNPCFNFPGGYFTYDYGGQRVQTGGFNFSGNFTRYELTVDAPSGDISSSFGSSLPAGCCGSAFVLAAIGAGALFARRV
jgi:hypothetical protein